MSVLTVADTDCRLIEIGSTASATGGHVCPISLCLHEILFLNLPFCFYVDSRNDQYAL